MPVNMRKLVREPGRVVIAENALPRKPKECPGCPILDDCDLCMLSWKVYKNLDEQYAECPLIEMPENVKYIKESRR